MAVPWVPRLRGGRGRGGLVAPLVVTPGAAILVFVLDDFTLSVVSLWVIYGLLALSLDLVWGRVGIVSFGQTAFFGVGGYTYGVIAINLIGASGESTTALLGGVLAGALLAALLGYLMFYGRVGDVYLGIMTLAVTLVLLSLSGSTAGSQYAIGAAQLGGYNGMVGIPPLTLGLPRLFAAPLGTRETYAFVVLVAGAVYILLAALLRAPLGRILTAVRENEVRTELLGYDTRRYKLLAFTMGGAIAGLAGATYAASTLFISPAVFSLSQAVLVVIWVLVGGRGTLAGAFLGVGLVQGLSTWLGSATAQTPLFLGLLLIVMVLVLPGGLVPIAILLWNRWGWQRRPERSPREPWAPWAPMSDSDLAHMAATTPRDEGGGSILETRGLGISFGGVQAVDGLTTQVGPGLHCLIGPNGAGKSTFFNLLVGRFRPTAGTILYRGRDITRLETYQRAQQGIGIKLQVPSIYRHLSVEENLWLAAYARRRKRGQATEQAMEALQTVGLLSRAGDRAAHLSHGEQQWLEIGMVIASNPALILLDEPTAGMTRAETLRTAQLITALARQVMVLVVAHDMELVRHLQAPVTVMHLGQIFKQGALDELRQDEAVQSIYLGKRSGAAR